MGWVATLEGLVVRAAWPLGPTGLVPSAVLSSRNVTVPVGVPLPVALAVTTAVKTTTWPTSDGLTEEETTTLVAAGLTGLTTWISTPDVLPLKVASPL